METYKEIDLTKLWQVIKADKKLIFISTGVTTLIAIIYCIFATPIYTASVLINPPKLSDAGSGIGSMISGLAGLSLGGGGGLLSQKTDADVAGALLSTNSVLDMQVNHFNLIKYYKSDDIEMARKNLIKNTKILPDPKSGFLSVSVDDKDPKLAASVANYYTVALGKLISNVALGKSISKDNFFEDQVQKSKSNLMDAQNKVKDFMKSNGILAGNQTQVIAGLITQLQAQLVMAQTQQNAMANYATSENPDYKRLSTQIASIKQQLSNLNTNDVNNEDKISIPSGLAPELSEQYINLMREYIMREEIYKLVIKQYEANKLDKLSEMDPTSIQVIDPAQVPLHKSAPKRLKIIWATIVFTGLFSVFFIIIRKRKYFQNIVNFNNL